MCTWKKAISPQLIVLEEFKNWDSGPPQIKHPTNWLEKYNTQQNKTKNNKQQNISLFVRKFVSEHKTKTQIRLTNWMLLLSVSVLIIDYVIGWKEILKYRKYLKFLRIPSNEIN